MGRRGGARPRAGVVWLGLVAVFLSYCGALVAVRALDDGEAPCGCEGAAANETGEVLLVGDSILAGYYPALREFLDPQGPACDPEDIDRVLYPGAVAKVVYGRFGAQSGRCGTSFGIAQCVERYVGGPRTFRIIHFNWGLHDIAESIYVPVTLAEYAANLERLYFALHSALAPNGTLVFATTTPVPPDYEKRSNADVVRLNDVAKTIFGPDGKYPDVRVNDLYARVRDLCPACYPVDCGCDAQNDGVHFSPAGYRYAALFVAAAVAPHLDGLADVGRKAPEVESLDPLARRKWDHWKVALVAQVGLLLTVGALYACWRATAKKPPDAPPGLPSPRLIATDSPRMLAAPVPLDVDSPRVTPAAHRRFFRGGPLSITTDAANV